MYKLAVERAREVFCQGGPFGALCPRNSAGPSVFVGERDVKLDGVRYRRIEMIWFINTGEWPKEQIIRLNGVNRDHRFDNLILKSQAKSFYEMNGQYGVVAPDGTELGLFEDSGAAKAAYHHALGMDLI